MDKIRKTAPIFRKSVYSLPRLGSGGQGPPSCICRRYPPHIFCLFDGPGKARRFRAFSDGEKTGLAGWDVVFKMQGGKKNLPKRQAGLGKEKRMFGGCALKASCRAEELFVFLGLACARPSREPRGVSSWLFSTQKKRAPTSGTPSIWRREEEYLRLYGLGCGLAFARGSMASASPRANLAEFLQISSPRHEKSPPKAGHSVAQRRGFEPPDESPPSHDFQSCSLNHSDISAKHL